MTDVDGEEAATATPATTGDQDNADKNARDAKRRAAFLHDGKCIVQFKSVGSAPPLKKAKVKVQAELTFHTVALYLRGLLKLKPTDPLVCEVPCSVKQAVVQFLYINMSFAPSPSDCIADLFQACSF